MQSPEPGPGNRGAGDERIRSRILVAEDDDDIRDFIVAGLRRDGHEVIEAIDGEQLIERVVEASPAPVPEVIVSDIQMPGKTGLEALAYLREGRWPVRFVLVSAYFDPATRAEAERLGADAFLRKPFDIYELREMVWRMAASPARS